MSYKTRKLQTILYSLTFERNNLINLYSHEIPSNKKLYLTKDDTAQIKAAIKGLSKSMKNIENIKGVL